MMSRYKPVGWRKDSYRHYLAAKGVSTKGFFAKRKTHQYYARDELAERIRMERAEMARKANNMTDDEIKARLGELNKEIEVQKAMGEKTIRDYFEAKKTHGVTKENVAREIQQSHDNNKSKHVTWEIPETAERFDAAEKRLYELLDEVYGGKKDDG